MFANEDKTGLEGSVLLFFHKIISIKWKNICTYQKKVVILQRIS